MMGAEESWPGQRTWMVRYRIVLMKEAEALEIRMVGQC